MEAELCEFLPWDSDFFGRRIARIVGDTLSSSRLDEIMELCRQKQFDCLYFLADAKDRKTPPLVEARGFHLVDVRIVLRHSLKISPPPISPQVRLSRPEDIPVLGKIARCSHLDTRFYYDPHFSPERCDDFYELWIQKSCQGYANAVLVAELEGQPAGYISCHLIPGQTEAKIGLAGVGAAYRGRGLGQQLVQAALRWFAEHEVKSVTVGTQGRNVPAQRLYQSCGFMTDALLLWYHLWLSDLDQEA